MKPDDKKHRDKARLDRKKEAGLAARTARKEARAVVDNPLQGDDARALVETVRHERGERRRRAFLALAELDATAATTLVDGLIDDAQGKNREELGRLLLWRGGPRHIDAIVAGRAGEVVVAGFATSDVVVGAATRLLPEVSRLGPTQVADRLRRLGVAPLVEAALEGIGARPAIAALLVAALHHPRRAEQSTSTRDAMVDALLRVSPDTLWTRCRDVLAESSASDPRLQLAGLAAGVSLDDAGSLIAWLAGLSAAERGQRLLDARLPDSARALDDDTAAALWRLCVLDEGMPPPRRQEAARLLWTRQGQEATGTLLLHPTLALDVTIALSRVVGFEEFWDAVGPAWVSSTASSTALRDALLGTPAGRRPEVQDAMRSVVRTNPLGFAAFAVQSDAPHAGDELLQAIDVADADDVPWLLLGTLTTTTGLGVMRERPVLPQLLQTLSRTEGGHDVVAGLQALRRALPRLPGLAVEIDAAIERIVRRYTLAR